MPFDFKAYDAKCNGLTPEELQREWEHYTRLISGASTSTAVSGMAIPFTLGVSTIGVAMAAPAIHNARKKRDIIEKHLQKHGATHVTRKRDVLGSMAVSGTIGVVTLGVGTMGADAVATAGAEHGIAAIVENDTAIKVVTHAALDGVGMGIEHAHTSHLKKKDAHKAFQKAGVFQAVQDAKAAEAGYSIQPYNPQTYASGSTTAQALPPPQYAYGSPMSPPPSYSTSPYYVYPSDSKSPAAYSASHQVHNYAVPSQPTQDQASQQHSSLPAPYQQSGTAVPTAVGYSQSQSPNSTTQPYASYVAPPPDNNTQAVPTSTPVITQQHTGNQSLYPQSTPGSSITSPSHDAYNMGTLTQSLPATPAASVSITPQPTHYTAQQPVPQAPTLPTGQSSDQQRPFPSPSSVHQTTGNHVGPNRGPRPQENHIQVSTPEVHVQSEAVPAPSRPTLQHLEQHHVGPQLQQPVAYASPPAVGSVTSDPASNASHTTATYNPASHSGETTYKPAVPTQQQQLHQQQQPHQQPHQQPQQYSQNQNFQQSTYQPFYGSNQYPIQPSYHQQYGHPLQAPHAQNQTSTQSTSPSSTYYTATPSQVPAPNSHQVPTPTTSPTPTYPLPTLPQSHQAYQPTPWAVPPPPPYPPPTQLAAQVQPHPTGGQSAPHPVAYDTNGPKNYQTYQQYPQAPAQQQQYQPAPPSFQPQYQTQQQVQQQTYNQPPTPVSPPYGGQVVPQGGPGYFAAMSSAQYQVVYGVPKGGGPPQGQGPYTPASTPGIV